MRTVSPLAVTAVATLVVCAAALTFGMVWLINPPSPTTRVVAEDGSEVTLDWRDFPASSDPSLLPEDVLAGPRLEEAPPLIADHVDGIRASLASAAPGLEWTAVDSDGISFFSDGGNGYGGESLHEWYNVSTSTRGGLDADVDWSALSDDLGAELERLGYGEIVWDFDRAPDPEQSQAQHDDDIERQFGSVDPDAMWNWSGWAQDGCLWASVTIWDERRGAPEDAWPEQQSGIEIGLGGTVISEEDEDAYAEGVAPFEGLPRPASTSSD